MGSETLEVKIRIARPHHSSFFNQVFISEGIPTLTWPNGADFNPDHLYDWPRFEQLYIVRAEQWEKQETAAN